MDDIFINIGQISTGFIEIPHQISLCIYAQGCKKSCPGCQNENLKSFDKGVKFHLSMIDSVLKDYPLCKWVCWLGGDAVYQKDSLIAFNKVFKSKNLNICLYTGVVIEELDNYILCNLDMIIDGEWTGKTIQDPDTNQRIWIKNPIQEWCQIEWQDLNKGEITC